MTRLTLLLLILPAFVAAQSTTNDQPPGTGLPDVVTVQDIETLLTTTESGLANLAAEFTGQWQDSAAACEEARGKLFGNMNAECRKIRAAIRQGEFLAFASQCARSWAATMESVKNAAILATELEANRDRFTTALTTYNEALQTHCYLAAHAQSHPALYGFFEEAREEDPAGFSDFSNVELADQIFDGQRRLMDQNFERERMRRENLLNQ